MTLANAGHHKGAVGSTSFEAEAEAFDALGPCLREALREAPIKILAVAIHAECRQAGLDPQEPALDAAMAKNVRAGIMRILLADRSRWDAELGLRPLRARRVRRRLT